MSRPKIYEIPFGGVYPKYVEKVERKGRTKEEVDAVIGWLTGYDPADLEARAADGTDLESFFRQAPALNPNRKLITGVICGVRVEEIEDPITQEIRYLDKVIDELAKGKAIEKVCRQTS